MFTIGFIIAVIVTKTEPGTSTANMHGKILLGMVYIQGVWKFCFGRADKQGLIAYQYKIHPKKIEHDSAQKEFKISCDWH